ncbi:MAG: helix-turn-helix domain-containing protein [Pseudomonadota bacterium]
MSAVPAKREVILNAAEAQFSQYGFRRTTMDDIARAAEVSRASLYSYFENKEEIFRSLSQWLFAESLQAARDELQCQRDTNHLEQRLIAGLSAFHARLLGALEATPHGAELMEEGGRLNADITQEYAVQIEALLAFEVAHAQQSGEIDLGAANLSAEAAAEVIHLAALGLKHGTTSFADYQVKLGQLLPLVIAGLKKA